MQPMRADMAPAEAAPSWRVLSWLSGALLRERERWVLWFPVLVGLGIGFYFWLMTEPPLWLGLVALVASSTLTAGALRAGRLLPLSLGALALSLGFAAAELQSWRVAAPILAHRLGPVAIEGRL